MTTPIIPRLQAATGPDIVAEVAASIGAVQDECIPGLWHVEGFPELTTMQLFSVAALQVKGIE